MINGAHIIIYTKDAEADRAFFRDVLHLDHIDAGHGWLIFALPASELACHPSEAGDKHELYLMCDDISAFLQKMSEKGFACSPPENQGWGIITHLTLPGGGQLGVYQPRHQRPTH